MQLFGLYWDTRFVHAVNNLNSRMFYSLDSCQEIPVMLRGTRIVSDNTDCHAEGIPSHAPYMQIRYAIVGI